MILWVVKFDVVWKLMDWILIEMLKIIGLM